jgi:hypothetical protein
MTEIELKWSLYPSGVVRCLCLWKEGMQPDPGVSAMIDHLIHLEFRVFPLLETAYLLSRMDLNMSLAEPFIHSVDFQVSSSSVSRKLV